VLEEAGLVPPSYATLKARLPAYATETWRQQLSAACAAHAGLGPASLVPDCILTHLAPASLLLKMPRKAELGLNPPAAYIVLPETSAGSTRMRHNPGVKDSGSTSSS